MPGSLSGIQVSLLALAATSTPGTVLPTMAKGRRLTNNLLTCGRASGMMIVSLRLTVPYQRGWGVQYCNGGAMATPLNWRCRWQ